VYTLLLSEITQGLVWVRFSIEHIMLFVPLQPDGIVYGIIGLSICRVCLSSVDETYMQYSLAPTDDLIRFWRSKVKVTTGCLSW